MDRTTWDSATAAYDAARALSAEMAQQHDAAERLADCDDPEAKAAFAKIEADYWRQIDAQEEAGNAVLLTPAPDAKAIETKLTVIGVEHDNRLTDWIVTALLADLRSIGEEA